MKSKKEGEFTPGAVYSPTEICMPELFSWVYQKFVWNLSLEIEHDACDADHEFLI
jgi:hypothetical protein